MTPLLAVEPTDPPANCFPVYDDPPGVPPYDGSGPSSGPCPRLLFRGDPKQLWHESPYRQDRPESQKNTKIHDISVYLDREVNGEKRDIALLADMEGPGRGRDGTGGIYVVDITDAAPVVLNFWQSAARFPIDSNIQPQGGEVNAYHHAEFVDGDDTLFVMVDEALLPPAAGFCRTEVHLVRVSEDLTEAIELAKWRIPPPVGSEALGTDGWPGAMCSPHYHNTRDGILYLGTHGDAGTWIVDLRRLAGYSQPIPSDTAPCLPEVQRQHRCVPYLREYPPPEQDPDQTKPDAGHYIPDGAGAWRAVFHRPKGAKHGYVYSTGDAANQRARGLDVYECVGGLSPNCRPRTRSR